jgi:hypothetical protein
VIQEPLKRFLPRLTSSSRGMEGGAARGAEMSPAAPFLTVSFAAHRAVRRREAPCCATSDGVLPECRFMPALLFS